MTVSNASATWEMPSGDGQRRYTVAYNAGRWSCNCPAGQHGRTCKHVNSVVMSAEWSGDHGDVMEYLNQEASRDDLPLDAQRDGSVMNGLLKGITT